LLFAKRFCDVCLKSLATRYNSPHYARHGDAREYGTSATSPRAQRPPARRLRRRRCRRATRAFFISPCVVATICRRRRRRRQEHRKHGRSQRNQLHRSLRRNSGRTEQQQHERKCRGRGAPCGCGRGGDAASSRRGRVRGVLRRRRLQRRLQGHRRQGLTPLPVSPQRSIRLSAQHISTVAFPFPRNWSNGEEWPGRQPRPWGWVRAAGCSTTRPSAAPPPAPPSAPRQGPNTCLFAHSDPYTLAGASCSLDGAVLVDPRLTLHAFNA
jgi:hypothetical protein